MEDQAPTGEEEDIQPLPNLFTPTEIEAFKMIELARIQNKYLTRENILLKDHIAGLKNIGETIFKLHEKIEHLQAQIYDLQNQNCEYEYRFKRMSLAADLRFRRLDHSSMMVNLCLGRRTTSLRNKITTVSTNKEELSIWYGHSTWQLPSSEECPGIVSPSHRYLYRFS